MVKAPGVRVPLRDAQRTRTQLAADGSLRTDLAPLRDETSIVFPIKEGADAFDFQERRRRPASYHDLLPEPLRDAAPRAFDTLGDVAILKIPAAHWEDRQAIGDALLEFLSARAVFHDHGVTGTYRVRELERIAGSGSPATTVQEHGVTLHVDVSRAYFSPRLADERGRVASLVQPGEFNQPRLT